MMMTKRLLAATALIGALTAAQADAATFSFNFSGASFGNSATATGSFTIDDAALARINANPFENPLYSAISNLTLTVAGTAGGNGTFTTDDFAAVIFSIPSPLDFRRELVGQSLNNGTTFGRLGLSGESGDFNLFRSSVSVSAPSGVNYFTLGANGGGGDERMGLTSLTTGVVPEPATWGMMIVGIGMLGASARYRRRSTKAVYA